jgi:hypothetical protein
MSNFRNFKNGLLQTDFLGADVLFITIDRFANDGNLKPFFALPSSPRFFLAWSPSTLLLSIWAYGSSHTAI